MMVYHLKTGHFSPVLEWLTIILTSVDPNHSKTGHLCPVFKCLDHLNNGLYKVPYSDESGIRMSSIQMVTVFKIGTEVYHSKLQHVPYLGHNYIYN